MPRKVLFARTMYLGDLPDTKPSRSSTYLWITDLGIGHGPFGPRDRNFVAWDRTAGVVFESRAAAESRADNLPVFEVPGVAGEEGQPEALVSVQLKDGNRALYRVVGKSGDQVRGKVQQFLVANGVPCLDDVSVAEPDPDVQQQTKSSRETRKLI
ncbi:MAG: hypothetical protein WB565_05595 [Acidimicrobiales bacterium]